MPDLPSGTVCLQGGAEFGPACHEMDAELLGRAAGPVVVSALAGAPGEDYRTATANGVRHFRALARGLALPVDVLGAPDARTDPTGALAALRQARLLVLPGGSPSRLREALRGTGVDHVVREVLDSGGVVLGASAGAMVLGEWMVLPDSHLEVVDGLGVVQGTVVLPHYAGGQLDWIAAIEKAVPAGTRVLGLPEQSGVVLRAGSLTAVGREPSTVLGEPPLPVGQSRRW